MKRNISLYLNYTKADLEDDTFVVFNYALSDLTNPSIMRNSWSNEITLPKTPNNNKLFGDIFRLDRVVDENFNPSKKTPFEIYNEANEIVVSGYAKLNRITDKGYEVGLFGGLGEFLYNLAYDIDGEQRTLASLDFGEDLDFTINRDAVLDAWARLNGDNTKPSKWDIINFAPCYNGIPNDFESKKGLTSLVPAPIDGYDKDNGRSVVTLGNDIDEWAAKDLRSYLQRPVLSMRKLIQAIADPANNGGWSVDYSDIDSLNYLDTWLTRPLLPSLGTFKQQSGELNVVASSALTTGTLVGNYQISDVPAAGTVTIRMTFTPSVRIDSNKSPMTPWGMTGQRNYAQVLFVQAVGYADDDTLVAASDVLISYHDNQFTTEKILQATGFTPVVPSGGSVNYSQIEEHSYQGNQTYKRARSMTLELTGVGVAKVRVYITAGFIYYNDNIFWGGGITTSNYGTFLNGGDLYNPTSGRLEDMTATATLSAGDTLRSGALITKELLLSTEHSPADYLLSFCKCFGLYLLADRATKSVKILSRRSLFQNETIDLTGRVETTKEITPLCFDAKYYDFKQELIEGRFAKEYKDTTGQDYGIQRVNTGYEFDNNTKDLLEKSILKGCATIQDHNPYWCKITDIDYVPSPFIDGGKYTLWLNGQGKDFDLPKPPSSSEVDFYFYRDYYDACARAEFRDKDNKGLDGADVLLFYTFHFNMGSFKVSDDIAAMDVLAGGSCWLLDEGEGVSVPQFTRYWHRGQAIELMLDFGYPREVDIPDANFYAGGSVYEQRWKAFIGDRLSVHGKVFRAKVDLSGLQVNQDLLRKFYWYQNSLWVLNKIENYSLTTFDNAECEFIQVRDKTNYY